MSVELVLVHADGQMRTIPLGDGRHVIGRAKGVKLRIGVDIVSREHAELIVSGDGVTIRDLGSSNGTYVNCQRVEEQELDAGDLLAIGPAVYVIRVNGEPADIDPEDAYEDGAPSVSPGLPSNEADSETASPGGPSGSSAPAPTPASSLDELDESSLVDFNFSDLDEDDDDQPSL